MYSLFCVVSLVGSVLALPTSPTTTYGYLPPPPPNPSSSSCQAKSTSIKEWTVRDFDFHASYIFTTPAHQNSNGYVNFTLSNAALDYNATCSGSSSQLSDFFYGNLIYKCDLPMKSGEANFTFSRPDNTLNINQTWGCADEGSQFTAEGGVKLNLDCKDENWQNPNWQIGQIYSSRTITCAKITAPAPIQSISAIM